MKHANFFIGFILGAALFGGSTAMAAAGITAVPSWSPIYVDGQQVSMTAYNIGGNNYVKLRDIGQAVGFNVYWDNGVQVDSASPYTGVAPEKDTAPAPAPAVSANDVEAIRQEIVDRTNALRRENGLPALVVDPMLTQAAQVRADEMAATSTYSHTRPDGSSRLTVTDSLATAENIHRLSDGYLRINGQQLAETVVEEWAASEDHREFMLAQRFSTTGVGLARGVNFLGQECWYCVQWFMRDDGRITWVDQPILSK